MKRLWLGVLALSVSAVAFVVTPSASADDANFLAALDKSGVTRIPDNKALQLAYGVCSDLRRGAGMQQAFAIMSNDLAGVIGSSRAGTADTYFRLAIQQMCPAWAPGLRAPAAAPSLSASPPAVAVPGCGWNSDVGAVTCDAPAASKMPSREQKYLDAVRKTVHTGDDKGVVNTGYMICDMLGKNMSEGDVEAWMVSKWRLSQDGAVALVRNARNYLC